MRYSLTVLLVGTIIGAIQIYCFLNCVPLTQVRSKVFGLSATEWGISFSRDNANLGAQVKDESTVGNPNATRYTSLETSS